MHLINCSHHNSWAGLCLWCGYLYSRAVDSDEGRRLRFTYIDKSLANKSYWNHVSWRFNIIIAVLKITLSTTIMVALSGITSNTLRQYIANQETSYCPLLCVLDYIQLKILQRQEQSQGLPEGLLHKNMVFVMKGMSGSPWKLRCSETGEEGGVAL